MKPYSMSAQFDGVVATPFGALAVRLAGEQIGEIAFLPAGTPPMAAKSRLAVHACAQLERYLSDPDTRFDVPLAPAGTAFQRKVWWAIAAIPRGKVRTYGDLARELGSAPRAVGQACGANPYPIVVPCHRVVAAGALGGFAHARGGWLADIKRWLLAHERTP